MACKLTDRKFLGFDLDPDGKSYVGIANARISATKKPDQTTIFDMDNV